MILNFKKKIFKKANNILIKKYKMTIIIICFKKK